jgi:2-hydroxymuconate-semialdehyde hydrolase
MNEGQNRRCTVGRYELAYREAGSGPPVLLVHGITTYSFIWRRVVPLLGDGYRVVAVDLLGCGESDKPLDADCGLRGHADLLLEFAAALGMERFHMVGHDVGGGIAQIFAVRYPERLLDLTLVNSVGYDFWPVQPISSLRAPIIRQLLMATLDRGALKLLVRRGLFHKARLTPELMAHFWAPMGEQLGRKAFLHFARCLDNADLMTIEEQLRGLAMPVLVVRGEGDVYLSSQIAERLHREIPGCRFESIEEGGHFIQEDQPERLAEVLRAFFHEDGRPGGR